LNRVAFVTALVYGFMLAEQRLSRHNERRLRDAGAIEPPGDPFVALALVYPLAFFAMGLEGAWRALGDAPIAVSGPSWAASGVLLFAASKALKYWAIGTLGERWSFRVLVQPGRPLVTRGPYAYLAHPNYVAVIGELAGTAMMVNAPVTGPVMIGAFALVLRRRVRVESLALRGTEPLSTELGQKGTELVATGRNRKA
jgi:methyltransferase